MGAPGALPARSLSQKPPPPTPCLSGPPCPPGQVTEVAMPATLTVSPRGWQLWCTIQTNLRVRALCPRLWQGCCDTQTFTDTASCSGHKDSEAPTVLPAARIQLKPAAPCLWQEARPRYHYPAPLRGDCPQLPVLCIAHVSPLAEHVY